MAKRQQFSWPLRLTTLLLKFENVVPEGWIRFFPCYIKVIIILLYGQVRVRVRVRVVVFSCFLRKRAARNKHLVPYGMLGSFCRFLGHSTQTQIDCESCSVHPKIHHAGKRSLAMCEHTGGVLGEFDLASHRDIRREHSLIGRRNCLVTEAAISLSAAAGRELSITREPTAGLAWVRVCVLWRPVPQ